MRLRPPAWMGTGLLAASYVLGFFLIAVAFVSPIAAALLILPFVVLGLHPSEVAGHVLISWSLPVGVVGLVLVLLSGFGRSRRL